MALDPFAPLRFGLRIGIGVLRFELRAVEHLLGLDREPPERADLRPDVPIATQAEPEPIPVQPEPAAPQPPMPEPDEPQHVDTQAELVGEFAEAGAEEGAGAEIHVDEPWEGYRRMRVADIRDRVAVANAAELAVIQLYEGRTRGRRSILDAVARRTRELANAPR